MTSNTQMIFSGGPVVTMDDRGRTAETVALPPGEWIIGYGYDRSALEGGREITAHDIDAHFPDHPVVPLAVRATFLELVT